MLDGQELVIIAVSAQDKQQMERGKAIDFINEGLKKKLVSSKGSELKSALKKTAPVPSKVLPSFFDIREEIDTDGNEISSEAVNISQHLEILEKQHSTETHVDDLHTKEDSKVLSDEEYSRLASRLDELAKLEKSAEAKRANVVNSSSALQSKGWAKGFLDRKKPPKTTNRKTTKAPPSTSRRISSDVLATSVQERSKLITERKKKATRVTFSEDTTKLDETRIESTQPKPIHNKQKKLSRFAMERLQNRL